MLYPNKEGCFFLLVDDSYRRAGHDCLSQPFDELRYYRQRMGLTDHVQRQSIQ